MRATSVIAGGLLLLACARASAQEADEGQAFQRTFEQKLVTHPYFSKIALERVESHPPYLFLVQKTGAGDADRTARLVQRYVERFDPALELFERELVVPLGLAQREDHPRFVVAVLASPGDLENYQRVTQARWHLESQGLYDRTLDAAVLCEDPFHAQRSTLEDARSARHVFLHVCQQAWYGGGKNAPFEHWVMEAMACELARRGTSVEDVSTGAENVRQFLLDLEDPARSWAHARTIEELFTVADPARLDSFFRTRADPTRPEPADFAAAWWAFYRQSALLLRYLWEGDDARHRPALLAFLRQVFAGRNDWPSFETSLEPASAGEIEAGFLAWTLRAVPQASLAADGIDPARVMQAFARDAGRAAPGDAPETVASGPAPPGPGEAALDLADATPGERLALAIDDLARGRTREGLVELEALLREAPDAAERERAERERRRVLAWIELRDAFLRERMESGALLEFTYKGRKLKSRVLGYADEELRLEKSRAPERLPVEAVDALELAQQIKPAGGANDWARLHPYVLRQDPRAKKLLKDDGGEAGALLADLREDYPARLRLGAAASALAELARAPVAADPAGLRAEIEALRAWGAENADLALSARKRPALLARARALLERQVELSGAHTLLGGAFEALDGERARLTYRFDDPRELEDFAREPYPALAAKALGDEQAEDIPFQVEAGGLTAKGRATLRSLVDLAAPMTVRYSLEFLHEEVEKPYFALALGLCDDGLEHFVWAINFQTLQRHEGQDSEFAQGEQTPVFMNTPYQLELRHDGTTVALLCEGKEQRTLSAGARKAGALFLCASSDFTLRIEELVIEAGLLPGSFDRLAKAWVERELGRFQELR